MNEIAKEFLRELESEMSSTRKCIERMKEELFEYKPHEKSMQMGYLAVLVADIPRWIAHIIEKGEINLTTWDRFTSRKPEDLLEFFDKNVELAKAALEKATDASLLEPFYLKMGEQELSKDTKRNTVSSTINHLVHHRGQLTVYMRLNNIPVPSIYGPTADDKSF